MNRSSKQAGRFLSDDYRAMCFFEKVFDVAKYVVDVVNLCKKEIAYTDGDIFHGNEDRLLDNQTLLKNRVW